MRLYLITTSQCASLRMKWLYIGSNLHGKMMPNRVTKVRPKFFERQLELRDMLMRLFGFQKWCELDPGHNPLLACSCWHNGLKSVRYLVALISLSVNIASHCIILHCIASHCITSHRKTSHRIASHCIASHHIWSHQFWSHNESWISETVTSEII